MSKICVCNDGPWPDPYNFCPSCGKPMESISPSDATACSVTDSGARILHKEDVILALMGVGLGAKLINEALENLGFRLDAFPSQNAEQSRDDGKGHPL